MYNRVIRIMNVRMSDPWADAIMCTSHTRNERAVTTGIGCVSISVDVATVKSCYNCDILARDHCKTERYKGVG